MQFSVATGVLQLVEVDIAEKTESMIFCWVLHKKAESALSWRILNSESLMESVFRTIHEPVERGTGKLIRVVGVLMPSPMNPIDVPQALIGRNDLQVIEMFYDRRSAAAIFRPDGNFQVVFTVETDLLAVAIHLLQDGRVQLIEKGIDRVGRHKDRTERFDGIPFNDIRSGCQQVVIGQGSGGSGIKCRIVVDRREIGRGITGSSEVATVRPCMST